MILVKLCRYQPSVGDQYSERARQRRVLMNRETVLNQLRYEVSKLTAKMFRAIQDHRTLRDHMASLVVGGPVPISTPVGPIVPIYEAAPNTPDPRCQAASVRVKHCIHGHSPSLRESTDSRSPPPIKTGS